MSPASSRSTILAAWIALTLAPHLAPICRAAEDTNRSMAASLALDDYLEAISIPSLRAAHLERLMYNGQFPDRTEYARRLSVVYARLMEEATSEEATTEFEGRCVRLLEEAPSADTLDLRLALARARYMRDERIAERLRIGLVNPADAEDTRRAFIELMRVFDTLAERAESRLRELDRQQESGAPRDELMMSAQGGSRRARSLARYLGGWSAYYAAELDAPGSGAADAAQAAQLRFGALLEARRGAVPTRDRVSAYNLRFDHIARAALGVALCWSIRENTDEALQWIDLVSSAPGLEPAVAAQITARRIIVLARAREWGRLASYAQRLVAAEPDSPTPATPLTGSDARLLAWLTLDPRLSATQAVSERLLICKVALGSLASSADGGAALDLVDRYLDLSNQSEPASAGFLARHLRALRDYDAARRAHKQAGIEAGFPADSTLESPTTDPGALVRYRSALTFADAALTAHDAGDFKAARPFALLIGALARFFSAADAPSLTAAAIALENTSHALDGQDRDRAAQALRLAIRAVDLALATPRGSTPDLKSRRQTLVNDYIARFPQESAAGVYAYQRATSGDLLGDEAVQALLAVEGGDTLRNAARYEAARLLYERFTGAASSERSGPATRFLDVATPLLDDDRRRLLTGAGADPALALLNARRALDVAFSLDPPAQDAATKAFDLLSTLILRTPVTDPRVLAEFRFRSVQMAILSGDHDSAEREAATIASMDATLAKAARREILRSAMAQWAAGRSIESARRLLKSGRPVLADLSDPATQASPSLATTISAAVAQAAAYLWAEAGDANARELAAVLYRTALRADARNRILLEDAGTFFEAIGQRPAALDAWRTLLSGLSVGGDDWYRAKVRVLSILADLEPARAREALDQHRSLYPELGPSPWGAQLLEIDNRLAAAGFPRVSASSETKNPR